MPDEAGRRAVRTLKERLAATVATALERDPERHRKALELGIIDPAWLDDPAGRPVSALPPLQAVERFVARYVEEHPSLLARLGVSPLDVLGETEPDPGRAPAEPLVLEHVTVVFTDLEGFTAYTEREGDGAASRLLAGHYDKVGALAATRGGRVVKRLGDGLMLTFPTPPAAVRCALELVDAAPPPLRLRAGVHAGEVVLAGGEVVGHVVNLASRVAGAAAGGQVLATRTVRDAARGVDGCRFGRVRAETFKGLDEPVEICPVRPAR